MRLYLAVMVFLLAQPPLAAAIGGDDDLPNRLGAEQTSWIRGFLDRFVDANKTPSEQAAFFTDDVEYYDQGTIGKPAIMRDVERYIRHWPQRRYRVTAIEYIAPEPVTDRVFVSYTVDFEVSNQTRTVSGRANYGAVIRNVSTSPRIEWIQENVTERNIVGGSGD